LIYTCANCGGNVIFDPKSQHMKCPQCDAEDSEKAQSSSRHQEQSRLQCQACGAPLNIKKETTACKCEYCGTYHVIESRLKGEKRPHVVMPFRLTKDEVIACIAKSVGSRTYAPDDFLSKKTIEKMEGRYVPFWLYDYDLDAVYKGVGTKVRTWRSGNYVYTETSYYNIYRNMEFNYNKIPADASEAMADDVMDLLEPFDYNDLYDFKEKYLSGFLGRSYTYTAHEMAPRAKEKAESSAKALVQETIQGYSSTNGKLNFDYKAENQNYTLLPIWIYDFKYQGKTYSFHVNGQSGQVVGIAPIDRRRVIGYSMAFTAMSAIIAALIYCVIGVI